MFAFGQAPHEEAAQQAFQRRIGCDELVAGVGVVADVADVGEELSQGGVVFLGDEVWLGDKHRAVLEVDKAVRPIKFKSDLLRVEQVEDADVVFPVAEMLEGVGEFLGIGEKVGQDDDERALADFSAMVWSAGTSPVSPEGSRDPRVENKRSRWAGRLLGGTSRWSLSVQTERPAASPWLTSR